MSELMGPPSSWYDPPDVNEACNCSDCHRENCHNDEIEQWAKDGCDICVEVLAEAVLREEYCLIHHAWNCEEHGAINGGDDCTQHYLEA